MTKYKSRFKPGDLVVTKKAYSPLTKIQIGFVVQTNMEWFSSHLSGKVNQIYFFEDMCIVHVIDQEMDFYSNEI